jgi:uncharacterized coiled-coil protein SlyX
LETETIRKLSQQIGEHQYIVDDKMHRIKVLENEISTLQIKLSQHSKQNDKLIKEKEEKAKTLVWDNENFDLKEVEYVAKTMSLCVACQANTANAFKKAKEKNV